MSKFTSLEQGNIYKEGFNTRKKIDGELSKIFPDDSSVKVDNRTFEQISDEAKRDYLTLFCLKPVGEADMGQSSSYETVEQGECIWDKLTPSQPCSGNNGKCQKVQKRENLDKIVKSGGDFYYINKYGYKKPLGNNKNDFDASCSEKQIVEGSIANHLDYDIEYNDNLSNSLKRCDSGNYNLKYCKSDGKCDYAYLSPKGEIKLYGENTWESMKNHACGTLPIMNAKEYGFKDSHSFANKNENNEKWGQRSNRDMEDEMGVSVLEGKSGEEKANIIKSCFPYTGESSLNDYQNNVQHKLLSDIRVKEIQQAWTNKLNKANEQFFDSDGQENALQEQLNQWYDSTSGYCKVDESGERKCLSNNEISENYRKKLGNLKELEEKYNSHKDTFKETQLKLDTLFYQRTLWLGSAIILGAIALKQIRNV